MASLENHIKIHEHCKVSPPFASQHSLPLTFFDLFWLRFHPVERIFFYTLPNSQSHPSFFFQTIVPNLKSSLSLTLQHFLPLAGKIVWPSDSPKPFVQFNPDEDGVSLTIAHCDEHEHDDDDHRVFNKLLEYNSPQEVSLSRYFVPHLDSTDSFASIISIQVTFFPKSGFSIGISSHHAVLDGKSSTMFIKAWASTCKSLEETQSSPSLKPSLEPFFGREVINDPNDLESLFINIWHEISYKIDPNNSTKQRSLQIMLKSTASQHNLVRATFELKRVDLEKLNKRVLSKWNIVEKEPKMETSKPKKLSTFVLTCAYVFVCIAKANQQAKKDKEEKFACGFSVDCRARLDPPIAQNYFGNCVNTHIVETEYENFTHEDGLVIVAKKIYGKIKKMDEGVLEGMETLIYRLMAMKREGIQTLGVAGSTRLGVYEIDFGFGRPEKVEIASIDRGLTIGLAESKDLKGGVEVGLVLDKHVMGEFHSLFHEGLWFEE
ncbi:phenolic glucoside malonyltransferase 1-like [Vicia villosa]|uniref:phenolic glucoside malonyltransferase 1-like n=1 Tax=Vicia villosa TaxID=3911 RepID=UPI00273C2F4D|nr:phenolic glucoside malonyltransferase 1-like [Vicia villosa]